MMKTIIKIYGFFSIMVFLFFSDSFDLFIMFCIGLTNHCEQNNGGKTLANNYSNRSKLGLKMYTFSRSSQDDITRYNKLQEFLLSKSSVHITLRVWSVAEKLVNHPKIRKEKNGLHFKDYHKIHRGKQYGAMYICSDRRVISVFMAESKESWLSF